jgi:hypothetical protein
MDSGTPDTSTSDVGTADTSTPEASVVGIAQLSQGSLVIPQGSDYEFDPTWTSSSTSVQFTITNVGTATLNLTGSPSKVLVSGPDAAEFSVHSQPNASIAPSATSIFTLAFAPSKVGDKTATVTIANDSGKDLKFLVSGSDNKIVLASQRDGQTY